MQKSFHLSLWPLGEAEDAKFLYKFCSKRLHLETEAISGAGHARRRSGLLPWDPRAGSSACAAAGQLPRDFCR